MCDQVLELSDNIRKQIPENIDYDQTMKIMIADTSPLKTVLLQEVCVHAQVTLCFLSFIAVYCRLALLWNSLIRTV